MNIFIIFLVFTPYIDKYVYNNFYKQLNINILSWLCKNEY